LRPAGGIGRYDPGVPDPSDGDLEARVRDLEHEVMRLKDSVEVSRADAAAARVLAGGADRDVSDLKTLLRAHAQSLNALRETQQEHQVEIRTLRSEMRRGFGTLQSGIAQIVDALPRQRGEDRPG
jgi:chromosome segregation ATPase